MTVTIAGRDGRVDARVADTGGGVQDAVRPHIFEPFFTTRGEHGALGIGLSMARAAARHAGGELTLETSGPGATFVLSLPAGRSV